MPRNTVNERLTQPHLVGPLTVANSNAWVTQPFAGRTDILSGTASIVVSTDLVQSASLIFATSADLPPGSGAAISVTSVVDATSFTLARNAAPGWDETVNWILMRT